MTVATHILLNLLLLDLRHRLHFRGTKTNQIVPVSFLRLSSSFGDNRCEVRATAVHAALQLICRASGYFTTLDDPTKHCKNMQTHEEHLEPHFLRLYRVPVPSGQGFDIAWIPSPNPMAMGARVF